MIRPAVPGDVAEVHAMVCELADYERGLDHVSATEDDLRAALFGESPSLFGFVADGGAGLAGFVLWFLNYSTWLGRHGIYIEDLYVRPAWRRRGIATGFLATLAKVCVERGYGRLEWWVLDWNTPAWDFYASLGAVPMGDWTTHRLTGPALASLAARAAQPPA